jgi:hypothetical protein
MHISILAQTNSLDEISHVISESVLSFPRVREGKKLKGKKERLKYPRNSYTVHLFISMERWMVLCYIKRNIGVLKIVSGL